MGLFASSPACGLDSDVATTLFGKTHQVGRVDFSFWVNGERQLGFPQELWTPSYACIITLRDPRKAKTGRTYTPESKAEAVKLATEQGYSIAEAALALSIKDNLIRN